MGKGLEEESFKGKGDPACTSQARCPGLGVWSMRVAEVMILISLASHSIAELYRSMYILTPAAAALREATAPSSFDRTRSVYFLVVRAAFGLRLRVRRVLSLSRRDTSRCQCQAGSRG